MLKWCIDVLSLISISRVKFSETEKDILNVFYNARNILAGEQRALITSVSVVGERERERERELQRMKTLPCRIDHSPSWTGYVEMLTHGVLPCEIITVALLEILTERLPNMLWSFMNQFTNVAQSPNTY